MLPVLYSITFFLMLSFIIIKKKNVSFTLIYFFSSALYYFHAFGGKLYWGNMNQHYLQPYPIDNATYIVLFINLVCVFIFCALKTEKHIWNEKKAYPTETIVIKIFILGAVLLSLYMCVKYNIFSRTYYNKQELLGVRDSLTTYYKFLSSFTFVYIWTVQKKLYSLFWKLLASFPLLMTFGLGHRSFIIISLCCVIFHRIYEYFLRKEYKESLFHYIRKHTNIIVGIVILIFITFAVKGITTAMFNKNYDLVRSRLSDSNYYVQTMIMSEPNVILGNLDAIVARDYHVDKSSYRTLWAYIFPILTKIIEKEFGFESFGYKYQADLFGTNYRASTYLGEAYANGSYICVIFLIISLMILLVWLFRLYNRCRCNITQTTLLLMAIELAFYIHRNSLSIQVTRIRDYLYIAIFLLFLIIISSRKKRIYF